MSGKMRSENLIFALAIVICCVLNVLLMWKVEFASILSENDDDSHRFYRWGVESLSDRATERRVFHYGSNKDVSAKIKPRVTYGEIGDITPDQSEYHVIKPSSSHPSIHIANGSNYVNTILDGIQTLSSLAKSETEVWMRILRMPTEGNHSFNISASDLIGNFRDVLPDTRTEGCKSVAYVHEELPRTSVIVIFHNEARSTLMRTLHGILRRTPDRILEELILVDDASTYPWLEEPLKDYLSHLPKVRLVRLRQREGLIRARLAGAEVAEGKVLAFLDAHVEVNVRWLEPLLLRLMGNPKVVAVPQMDIINWEHFAYWRADGLYHGSFTWNLDFKYRAVPPRLMKTRRSDTEPIPSPVMVGCAHAVFRDYFFQSGSYDSDMDIWGGENIEHSFRTWMCGGRVEVITCSRVGHVFKPRLPYSFQGDGKTVIQRNLIRTAEVWMDGYKKYYYATQGSLTPVDLRSLETRKELRKKPERCHDFRWYLRNVTPEMPIPAKDAVFFGQVHSASDRSKCLHLVGNGIVTINCEEQPLENQQFYLDTLGRFHHSRDRCISVQTASNGSPCVALIPQSHCPDSPSWQAVASGADVILKVNASMTGETLQGMEPLCLSSLSGTLCLSHCINGDLSQSWSFTYRFNFSNDWDIYKVTLAALRMPKGALHFGRLQNEASSQCLDVREDGTVTMMNCVKQHRYQQIIQITRHGEFRFKEFCLDVIASPQTPELKAATCRDVTPRVYWEYDVFTKLLSIANGTQCLAHKGHGQMLHPASRSLMMLNCNGREPSQRWKFSQKKTPEHDKYDFPL